MEENWLNKHFQQRSLKAMVISHTNILITGKGGWTVGPTASCKCNPVRLQAKFSTRKRAKLKQRPFCKITAIYRIWTIFSSSLKHCNMTSYDLLKRETWKNWQERMEYGLNGWRSRALFLKQLLNCAPPQKKLGVLPGIVIWGKEKNKNKKENKKKGYRCLALLTTLPIQLPTSCQRFDFLRYLHMKQQDL